MKASKRKKEDVDCDANQPTTVVVMDNIGGEENNISNLPVSFHSDITTTKERMKLLADQWTEEERASGCDGKDGLSDGINPFDGIAKAIFSIVNENKSESKLSDSLVQESEKVKLDLSQVIDQAKDLCIKENDIINELSEQLIKFQETRRDLLREIEDLDDRQRTSQQNIAIFQAEASEELDQITDVEEMQKRQVPRLKMTISLYASTTGIKWDFSDPDLLSGQVALPSQSTFKLFTIDPGDYSGVETADYLWGIMEGDDT